MTSFRASGRVLGTGLFSFFSDPLEDFLETSLVEAALALLGFSACLGCAGGGRPRASLLTWALSSGS